MTLLGVYRRFPPRRGRPRARCCSLCGLCGHYRVSHREFAGLSNEVFWAQCWRNVGRRRRGSVLHSLTDGRVALSPELVVMSIDPEVLRLVRSMAGG